jgi:hypothetical protein
MPDLHDATCRIGLRILDGAVSTPPYRRDGGTRRLLLDGTDVVDERDGREVGRVALAGGPTLGEVRAALGVTAPAPADIYDLGSPGDPGRPLALDPAATAALVAVLGVGHDALAALRAEVEGEVGSIQLWPEHLDVALAFDHMNHGASPGDDAHPEPYLYVGPWDGVPEGPFWNEPFGASRPALPPPATEDALAFFREGRARLGR